MKLSEITKIILSLVCLLAYTIPLLLSSSTSTYDYSIIDIVYGVGSAIGIGGYFISDSYKLKKTHEYYLFSAGIFFVGLSLIFILDTLFNRSFETYWYVIINLLITFICFILLIFRQLSIRL